jgi:hypothetical protein
MLHLVLGLFVCIQAFKPNVIYNYRERVKTNESFNCFNNFNNSNIYTLNLKLILIPAYYKKLVAVYTVRGLLMMGT